MNNGNITANDVSREIFEIQSQLLKHAHIYQTLIIMSCELLQDMFLQSHNKDLIDRWNEIVTRLDH